MAIQVFDPASDQCVLVGVGDVYRPVLYVRLPRLIKPEALSQVFAGLPRGVMRSCGRVILRAHSADAKNIETNADRLELRSILSARAYDLPVELLTWSESGYALTDLTQQSRTPDMSQELIADLRHADLWALAQRPGVLLPDIEDFHYEGPNEKHYRSFVRVGLAVQSPDELDSVAFWLLPYLANQPIVVLDSWTILSLGLNLHRYAVVHGLESATESVLLDALRHYDEAGTEFEPRLRTLIEQRTTDGSVPRILFVMSVASSGRAASKMRAVASAVGVASVDVVALFAAGHETESETVFCRLDSRFEGQEASTCEACRADSPLIRIEKTNYLLEMAADAKRCAIGEVAVQAARDFVSRYRGFRAIAIHRTRSELGEAQRHHMVHVDVERLLQHEAFVERLDKQIETVATMGVDVVLAPTHAAGRAMAQAVGRRLRREPIVVDEEMLASLPAHSLEALVKARSILIVDDVVTTGDRLRGFKRRLHDVRAIDESTNLMQLVGLSRAPRVDSAGYIRDMLFPVGESLAGRKRGQLFAVEEVLLPDWDHEDCPWCVEKKLLEQGAQREPKLREWAEERGSRLNEPLGLKSGIFLSWPRDRSPFVMVGPQSIFGERLSDCELFFCVASATQFMRSAGRLKEQAQPPMAYVLSPDSYLTGRYYEDMIDAAIIRACRRHDLRTSSIEEELIAKVGRRLSEKISAPLRGELVLAIASGKLPSTPRALSILDDPNGDPGMLEFARSLLRPMIGRDANISGGA